MNRLERGKMVMAMDTVARALNDEEVFEYWLTMGVADGDITDETTPMDEDLDCYCDDESFRELMFTFSKLMKSATQDGASGVFYVDRIVGKKYTPKSLRSRREERIEYENLS